MRSWVFLSLLVSICAAQECDLEGKKNDLPFPNIEKEAIESYQMSVEFTAPELSKTEYYTEYYDMIYNRGKLESHINGETHQYIYRTASMEAWEITSKTCTLKNITLTPQAIIDNQRDWLYAPENREDRRTIGPSAMFKIAFDIWNSTDKKDKMAYMGASADKVRGLDAQFWRRCTGKDSYVDYFFTADDDETPFALKDFMRIPLRVFFGGLKAGETSSRMSQLYEIISFQPYISLDAKPFQLPAGRQCKRGYVEDAPKVPDFTNKNLQFNAEVIYQTLNKDGEGTQFWSYYSTLFFALDINSEHLAYYYTPWSNSKPDKEPEVDAPKHIIFDMKHGFAYKTSLETGECEIIREKNFVPEYTLPNDAGSIALTDPSILFPNSELTYISEGVNRGLRVYIFEEFVKGYVLNKKNGDPISIPEATITHYYLQDDEVERNKVSVKNALAQVQLRFTGRNDMLEILTFNFFGFSTELRYKRNIFNIKRCFRNDDDYVWVTIGFNADKDKIEKVQQDVPSIESNILNAITLRSELNAVRIPVIEVDIKDGIYVSLLILGKPPVVLDFMDAEEGQTVTGTKEVEGVQDFDTCATECLETESNCWGFSMCGAVCYFGTESSKKVGPQKGCKLYRRYDMEKFIPSKKLMVDNLRRQVKDGGFSLVLRDKDDNMVQIDASSIEVTEPGEDDRLFNRIGNSLNPRMRVLKAGYKLKITAGSAVKNMGKLRYDECQRLCLDFKDCETASYCLTNSECILSGKYSDDIKAEEFVADNMCNLLTRKYADHFDRSPGNVLSTTAEEILDLDTVEKCARACLAQTKFNCLSFDHCPTVEKGGCSLHTVHYPNSKTREKVSQKSTNCGHYFRKYSTEFKKYPEKRTVGSKVPPLSNLTLEECSKSCIEYGKGTCYGFDFCQGSTILQTSCILLDSDPSKLKTTFSPICTSFLRSETQLSPRPYTNSYAGGIGFLCFLVGSLLGVAIVFGIAYMRVNRR